MSASLAEEKGGLIVIGAGLMKTGTMSLQAALVKLLGGECYHMITVAQNPSHVDFWERMTKDEISDEEIREMMKNYTAAIGITFPFYQRLMRVYPNAKVILSVRDPKSWHRSVNNTIYKILVIMGTFPFNWLNLVPFVPLVRNIPRIRPMILNIMREKFFGGDFELDQFTDEAFMLRKFEEHVAEVKATVPADRLLVFEAKDGWGPLCRFLGVPEPDEAYPCVNTSIDRAETVRSLLWIRRIAWTVTIGVLAVAVFSGKKIYDNWHR